MTMEKAIKSGKEHRKWEYHDSRDIDPSCRCHGDCEYCQGNRMYRNKREKERLDDEESDFESDMEKK